MSKIDYYQEAYGIVADGKSRQKYNVKVLLA